MPRSAKCVATRYTVTGGVSAKNVEMQVEGHILTIKLDLTKEFGPSSSGKTTIVASTEGNVDVPDSEVKVGLNCYKARPR